MKLILIPIIVIVAGAFIFGLQSTRLKGLRKENQTLSERTPAHSPSPQSHAIQSSSKTTRLNQFPGVSAEEANAFGSELTDLMAFALEAKSRGELKADFRSRYLQLLQAAQKFSPDNIQTVMDILRNDARFPDKEEILEETLENLFVQVAPFSTLAYLLDQPSEERYHFTACFRYCVRHDRKRAFELYEENKENPAFDNQSIRDSLLISLVGYDPDRMLSLMTSDEFVSDNSRIGASANHYLETTEEHLEFMEALQRAQKEQPDSKKLQAVHKDYIAQLSNQIERRGFEEAQKLITAGFSPEEKMQAFSKISRIGDLASTEQWAQLFLEVDLNDWNNWIEDQPNKFKHPFVKLMQSLGFSDNNNTAETAENILASVPAGELRTEAIKEFAWTLVSYGNDPETAAKYLDEIPEGKVKAKIQRRIAQAK